MPATKPSGKVEPIRGQGPNILMVMSDQHRADWMGCAGADWVQTPNLDALAQRGVRFANAICNSPVCAPSRAALASGLRCSDVGVLGNSHLYPYHVPTYYQALRLAGYRVGCVGKTDLHKRDHWEGRNGDRPLMYHFGFTDPTETEGKQSAARDYGKPVCPYQHYLTERGLFETFAQDYASRGKHPACYAADSALPLEAFHDAWIGQRACEFLETVSDESPWHYFVSFVGPHNPWDPPKQYGDMYRGAAMPSAIQDPLQDKPRFHGKRQERESRGLTPETLAETMRKYAGMTTLNDYYVGQFVGTLERRGMLDNTVIMYTADHGEMMGDHGLFHKSVYYEAALKVPLIVCGPGIAARGDSDALVEMFDLAPTALELAKAEPLPDIAARSLMPVLRGETETHREHQLSELGKSRMVSDGRYKFVERPGDLDQLYDLSEDPAELANLAEKESDRVSAMRRMLEDELGPRS
ncbi:MAG: sulfatase-like hydrolase/transferase [Armatimonadota bacterium]